MNLQSTLLLVLGVCVGIATAQPQPPPAPLLPYIGLSTNFYPQNRTPFLIEVGIIRLLMARTNADPITTALQQKEWNSIVSALDSIGDADQLYYAVREVSPSEPQTLSFSSLEHRPPLIISGIKDQPKVYNTFGLDLHLAFPPVEQGNFGTTVSWKGNYSWSTNFLSKSKLQRFAAILHKIGSLTGAGFSDDRGKKGRPRGGGGIVLFKAKEIKAKEAGLPEKPEDRADYKLHYYGAPRGFSSLAGNAHLVPGVFYSELIRQEGSSFECFLLLIRYQEFE